MKAFLKAIVLAVFLVLAFPMALLSGFGKFAGAFTFFAHWCAFAPGLPGDYLRIAFYRMTLSECHVQSRISVGSFFAHSEARMARGVYIGAYCVLGAAVIGDRTLIASGVQILAGKNQHPRTGGGRLTAASKIEPIRIGSDCWIGAGAILMADVGDGSTVGAGSVVTKYVPAKSIVAGNPARAISSSAEMAAGDTGYEAIRS